MAHIHEKIDFTVTVYVVYGSKVLLRKHDKYPYWLGVGGHVALDEDPNQAALREAKEEAGLEVVLWDGNRRFRPGEKIHRELIPPVGMSRHRTSPTHEHVDLIYVAQAPTDSVEPTLQEDRSDEWVWLAKEELDAFELLPDVRFYAKLALDTLTT